MISAVQGSGKPRKLKGFLFLAVFYLQVCPLWAAGCPKDPHFKPSSVIHVSTHPVQVVYSHDLSTTQIESFRYAKLRSNRQHNPGLTTAEQEFKTNFEVGGVRRSNGKLSCVWAESVMVKFFYTEMNVYISSHYPEGSCPYRAILAHENQHVATNRRVMEKYKVLMERVLKASRSIPTKANPLAVRSLTQGEGIIKKNISRLINPLYRRYLKELQAENAKIDTPANYRRVQSQCQDW